MYRDLLRRIRRLQPSRSSNFPDKLRALARRLGLDEAEFLRALQDHQRELDRHLSMDGITCEGLELLDDLLRRARPPSPAAAPPCE